MHEIRNNWVPIVALPNISLEKSIEGGFFRLCSCSDSRLRQIKKKHKSFDQFLSGFTDTFGRSISPAVILIEKKKLQLKNRVSAEFIASFRNIIATSIVPNQWALSFLSESGSRILYSDYFSIYPWMIDRDYEHVIANTPGQLAIDEARKFRGQQSPQLSVMHAKDFDFDRQLLCSLLKIWNHHIHDETPTWENIALFRSLNMAYEAMRFPAETLISQHDVGRMIGLWVSAFEILAHPGNEKIYWLDIAQELESINLASAYLPKTKYEVKVGKKVFSFMVLGYLYCLLYNTRNDFMHGNPIRDDSLVVPGSDRRLGSIAPILYRMVLAKHINHIWAESAPESDNTNALRACFARKYAFLQGQTTAEQALALSLFSHEKAKEERRKARLARQARYRPNATG